MRKCKRILLLLLLCLGFSQMASMPGIGPAMAKAAAKEGLKTEKGKIYFYVKGKKIKNKWKTVGKDKYYFDKTGAAITGKKSGSIVIPKVYKISGKSYGFDNKGRMVKGLYVIKDEFYMFSTKDGAYKSSTTKKLRAAAKTGQKTTTLLALLKKLVGDPLSREDYPDSCYGDGKDSVLYYSGFMVQLFTDKKGKTTIVGVNAAARQDPPKSETTPATGAGTGSTGTQTPSTEAGGTGAQTPSTEAGSTGTQTESEKTAQKKRGLVEIKGSYYYYQKNGKKLKSKWKKIDGRSYYFGKNGKAKTYSVKIKGKLYVFNRKGQLQTGKKSRIVTIGIRKYYVDKKGCAITGWCVVGGKLYYADPKTGLIYQNRTYGGIKLSKTGEAENTTTARLKIKTMSILSSITNSKMSKSQKLRACWNYVVSGRFSYGSRYPNLNQSGWQRETALHMFNNHWGNCYSFACAFAALAKEVGYSPYIVCGRVSGSRDGAADGLTRHAWVQINGAYYDPEAQYAGWARGIYGAGGYYVSHQIQRRVLF